jgi:hypothetical protein
MDQADYQNRAGCPCGPMCDRSGTPVPAQAPAPAHRHPDPTRSQQLLVAATFVVALNAFIQALNVLAAWWGHGR